MYVFLMKGSTKEPIQRQVREDVPPAVPGGLQELFTGLQVVGGGGESGTGDLQLHGQVWGHRGAAGECYHWSPHHGVLRDVRGSHYSACKIEILYKQILSWGLSNVVIYKEIEIVISISVFANQ